MLFLSGTGNRKRRTAKRGKPHTNKRQRQLRHEQLEDRRLLTTDVGWLFGLGGDGANTSANDCDVDEEGNVYLSGMVLNGSVDLDPGPGVAEVSSPDNETNVAYVAKYAPDGSFLWARAIDGPSSVWANGVAVDANGDVYLHGTFYETITFGSTTLTSQGISDVFVTKLDRDGNFIWTVQAGGTYHDNTYGVDTDLAGNVYIAGYLKDTATFGGFEVTSNGGQDAFVAKLDSDGEFCWVTGMGGIGGDRALALASGSDGSIHVSGWFDDAVDFGGHQLVAAGERDGFVAKLDAAEGSVTWVQQVGAPSDVRVEDIAVGTDNSVTATGHFGYGVEIGPFQLTTSSYTDAFVAKMDSDGTILWARGTETLGVDSTTGLQAKSIALDGIDDIYISGGFVGTTDFDPSDDILLIGDDTRHQKAYLWKLNADGDFVSVKRVGGTQGGPASVDGNGDVYWAGSAYDKVYLPNGSIERVGQWDTFLSKLPAYMFETHDVLFSDSFENGQWNGQWVEDGQNDWITSTQRATLGSNSAEVDGRANNATLTVANPIDMTAYGSAELTFDWYLESSLDDSEYLAVELFDGSTWTEVARLEGNVDAENVWHRPYVQIPTDHLVDDFKFRFLAKMSKSDEVANVDNVKLVGTSLAGPPNNAPTANPDSDETDEDVAVTIDVLFNDTDPDTGDVLQVASVGQGTNGTVVNNGSDVTYTPDQDFNGTDTFGYTVTDGRGGTATATVTVLVNSVEDAPDAVDDTANTDEGVAVDVQVLDNDSDGDDDTLTITSFTQPANGTLTDHGTYFTYTPDAGFTGPDTFTYTINDRANGTGRSDTATVTINVDPATTNTAIYVADISFVQHGRKADWWQAIFEIHADSNDNGPGDDSGIGGIAITVEFAGQTFSGTTDSNGIFTTDWVKRLSSGVDYAANVLDLALASYFWEMDWDMGDDDDDGDGVPDNILNF